MNLVKTKRVRLKGKATKEFYNAIYKRDGARAFGVELPLSTA